jgi:hypothetical protein
MEFDPKQCGNYVYLAKWIQNCGKRCRVKEIDGTWIVSVADMMFIHGDFMDFNSSAVQWSKLKGKMTHYRLRNVAQHKICFDSLECGAAKKKTLHYHLSNVAQHKKKLR